MLEIVLRDGQQFLVRTGVEVWRWRYGHEGDWISRNRKFLWRSEAQGI
jgi:hypothetical protein